MVSEVEVLEDPGSEAGDSTSEDFGTCEGLG
jgi:hypothetical protein